MVITLQPISHLILTLQSGNYLKIGKLSIRELQYFQDNIAKEKQRKDSNALLPKAFPPFISCLDNAKSQVNQQTNEPVLKVFQSLV